MLVTPVLMLVAVAIIQLVLALAVRSTLASAAVEGARAAALAGSPANAAVGRVRQLLDGTVADAAVVRIDSRWVDWEGLSAIETRIDYHLSFLGLVLPTVLTVQGHVLVEGAR